MSKVFAKCDVRVPAQIAGAEPIAIEYAGVPYPLRTMLRVHCVQLWYDLSDPGVEELLYGVESLRRFAGWRLSGPLPGETMTLKFGHLLERRGPSLSTKERTVC